MLSIDIMLRQHNVVCRLQVRKTSQAALLVLLEQGLICKADMETKVCPVLLELTEPSSDDDYKTEAVAVGTDSLPY